jgi:hypothetical protein
MAEQQSRSSWRTEQFATNRAMNGGHKIFDGSGAGDISGNSGFSARNNIAINISDSKRYYFCGWESISELNAYIKVAGAGNVQQQDIGGTCGKFW